MDAPGFIKEHVSLFKDFSTDRIKELVNGSAVRSFETNEAIAHQGAEATHFGVVLNGTVAASAVTDGSRQQLGELKAGEYADFIVLSDDLAKIPPAQYTRVRVLQTVAGGRSVYVSR